MDAPVHSLLVSGAILAGGRSTRMGRDKAFLPLHPPGGPPLIAHQAALLRKIGIRDLIISGLPGLTYTHAVPDARVVTDTVADAGPLAGLASVIAAARHPHVLVLAVDLPLLTADYLQKLLGLSRDNSGVVPLGVAGYEPLVALYPRSLLPSIETALAAQRYSLQTLITHAITRQTLRALPIEQNERPLFANWNSPEDITG